MKCSLNCKNSFRDVKLISEEFPFQIKNQIFFEIFLNIKLKTKLKSYNNWTHFTLFWTSFPLKIMMNLYLSYDDDENWIKSFTLWRWKNEVNNVNNIDFSICFYNFSSKCGHKSFNVFFFNLTNKLLTIYNRASSMYHSHFS